MGCSYNRLCPLEFMDYFFSCLNIKKLTPKEFKNYIISTKRSLKSTDTLFDYHNLLAHKLFSSSMYDDESIKLFKSYLNEYGKLINCPYINNEEYNAEYSYFLMSLIFLCKSDNSSQYESAIEIINEFKVNINGEMIQKQILFRIIEIYITNISILAIPFVKICYNNENSCNNNKCENEFDEDLKDKFKVQLIDLYITDILLTYLKNYTVRLYQFYNISYYYLINDCNIRKKLVSLRKDEELIRNKNIDTVNNSKFNSYCQTDKNVTFSNLITKTTNTNTDNISCSNNNTNNTNLIKFTGRMSFRNNNINSPYSIRKSYICKISNRNNALDNEKNLDYNENKLEEANIKTLVI